MAVKQKTPEESFPGVFNLFTVKTKFTVQLQSQVQ